MTRLPRYVIPGQPQHMRKWCLTPFFILFKAVLLPEERSRILLGAWGSQLLAGESAATFLSGRTGHLVGEQLLLQEAPWELASNFVGRKSRRVVEMTPGQKLRLLAFLCVFICIFSVSLLSDMPIWVGNTLFGVAGLIIAASVIQTWKDVIFRNRARYRW